QMATYYQTMGEFTRYVVEAALGAAAAEFDVGAIAARVVVYTPGKGYHHKYPELEMTAAERAELNDTYAQHDKGSSNEQPPRATARGVHSRATGASVRLERPR